MPDDERDDLDGMCGADVVVEDPVADEDLDHVVLTAGVDQSDPEAVASRLEEYAALFPEGQP